MNRLNQRMEYSKTELRELCDRLLKDDAEAIEECSTFFEQETRGYWHGRARAMMARRLKHCSISAVQQTRLVNVILHRLVRGNFSEQFKDQLRLALQLDRVLTLATAQACQNNPAEYIRRAATWIMGRERPTD